MSETQKASLSPEMVLGELKRLLVASGPVLAWLKIVPDVENRPIKQRLR